MSAIHRSITSGAYVLRLPEAHQDAVHRVVQQHQAGGAGPEQHPFARQLNFWALAIATAVARGLEPASESVRLRKFVDTRAVDMPEKLCELLSVIALATLGPEHEDVDNPAAIIRLANRYAAAGCPDLLSRLTDPGLRLTPLEKALEFAAELRDTVGQHQERSAEDG